LSKKLLTKQIDILFKLKIISDCILKKEVSIKDAAEDSELRIAKIEK